MDREPQYPESWTDVYPEWGDDLPVPPVPKLALRLPLVAEDNDYGL